MSSSVQFAARRLTYPKNQQTKAMKVISHPSGEKVWQSGPKASLARSLTSSMMPAVLSLTLPSMTSLCSLPPSLTTSPRISVRKTGWGEKDHRAGLCQSPRVIYSVVWTYWPATKMTVLGGANSATLHPVATEISAPEAPCHARAIGKLRWANVLPLARN